MKMVAARAGLSEPLDGDRVRLATSAVASDPDVQSDPRCVEVPFFVAPEKGARRAVSQLYLQRHGRRLIAGGNDAGDD